VEHLSLVGYNNFIARLLPQCQCQMADFFSKRGAECISIRYEVPRWPGKGHITR